MPNVVKTPRRTTRSRRLEAVRAKERAFIARASHAAACPTTHLMLFPYPFGHDTTTLRHYRLQSVSRDRDRFARGPMITGWPRLRFLDEVPFTPSMRRPEYEMLQLDIVICPKDTRTRPVVDANVPRVTGEVEDYASRYLEVQVKGFPFDNGSFVDGCQAAVSPEPADKVTAGVIS